MIKWWHQNNWGKAACGRRTRALKCWRSCACKHSKFLVLEICFIVCNLSSNNFLRSLAEEAILICFNLLLQLSSINRTVMLCKHSIRTFNANTQFQHSNLQCKHSAQTFNPNIRCEYPIRTFTAFLTANIHCFPHCKHSMFTRFSDLVPKLRREDEAKCERALIDLDSEVRMMR